MGHTLNELPEDLRHSPVSSSLRLANAAGALTTAAFAVRGLRRPTYALPHLQNNPLAQFWAQASAARTLPLSAVLLFDLARRGSHPLAGLLLVAGLAQAGDAILGAKQRNPGMTLAPTALAALHLFTARRTWRN